MGNELSNVGYLINLLRSDGSIIINKRLAHSIGLNEAIMYSELLAKYKYFTEKNSLQDDGYFFNTVVDMQKDTTLSEYQQRKVIKNLEKLGLIDYKTKGLPAKRFFKIVEDEAIIKNYLMDRRTNLRSSSEETKELDTEKLKGNNTNHSNTNPNNTKVNVNGIKFPEGNIYSIFSKNTFKNNLKKIDLVLSSLTEYISIQNKEEYRKVLVYYLEKYAITFNDIHPELKKEYWQRVINNLFISPVSELVGNDIDTYYVLIDEYFATEYNNCDYHILHFATQGILDNKFYETCY